MLDAVNDEIPANKISKTPIPVEIHAIKFKSGFIALSIKVLKKQVLFLPN
jgi:hypothetical protein